MHKLKVGDLCLIRQDLRGSPPSMLQHLGTEVEIVALIADPLVPCPEGYLSAKRYGPIYQLLNQDGLSMHACESALRKLPPPNDALTDRETEDLWAQLGWRPAPSVRTQRTPDESTHTVARLRRSLSRNLTRLLDGLIP